MTDPMSKPRSFNPLRNIVVNLRATGPAAVICVWCISVAALGVFGEGSNASSALGILAAGGGMVLLALAQRT